ncbi:MAG: hypothetical protein AAFV88_07010 [Planctomycetota bacterium]
MTHIRATFETTATSRGQHRVTSPSPAKPAPPPRLPHVAKLMALAIRLDHLLDTGQVKDQAEIARTAGITRARVTQILNLTNLAPDIQQDLLELEPLAYSSPHLRERDIRQIATDPNWLKQRKTWEKRQTAIAVGAGQC